MNNYTNYKGQMIFNPNITGKLTFTEISRELDGDRNDKPEITYEVREDGRLLGKVSPTWVRNGGFGWTHSLSHYHGSNCGNRQQAARALAAEVHTRQHKLEEIC